MRRRAPVRHARGMSPSAQPQSNPTPRSRAVSLAYERSGQGIPVVFLHGLTFDRRTWRPIVDRLGDRVLEHRLRPARARREQRLGARVRAPRGADPRAARRARRPAAGRGRPLHVGRPGHGLRRAAPRPGRGDRRRAARRAPVRVPGTPARAGAARRRVRRDLPRRLPGEHGTRPPRPPTSAQPSSPASGSARTSCSATGRSSSTASPTSCRRASTALLDAIDVPVLGVFGRELEPPDRERLARIPDAAWEEWPDTGTSSTSSSRIASPTACSPSSSSARPARPNRMSRRHR